MIADAPIQRRPGLSIDDLPPRTIQHAADIKLSAITLIVKSLHKG